MLALLGRHSAFSFEGSSLYQLAERCWTRYSVHIMKVRIVERNGSRQVVPSLSIFMPSAIYAYGTSVPKYF